MSRIIDIDRIKALESGTAEPDYKPPVSCFTDTDLVVGITAWAEDKDNFNGDFVDKMAYILESGKDITEGQRLALENIVKQFNIDLQEYL